MQQSFKGQTMNLIKQSSIEYHKYLHSHRWVLWWANNKEVIQDIIKRGRSCDHPRFIICCSRLSSIIRVSTVNTDEGRWKHTPITDKETKGACEYGKHGWGRTEEPPTWDKENLGEYGQHRWGRMGADEGRWKHTPITDEETKGACEYGEHGGGRMKQHTNLRQGKLGCEYDQRG